MPYFAQIDENNIVVNVISAGEEYRDNGEELFSQILGGVWKRTSYNTHGGVNTDGNPPYRKNFAGTGYVYDEIRDAFYCQQPYPDWTLNEETCLWQPPPQSE